MANTRLSMRKIREILRVCWGSGLSARQAAASCGSAGPPSRSIWTGRKGRVCRGPFPRTSMTPPWRTAFFLRAFPLKWKGGTCPPSITSATSSRESTSPSNSFGMNTRRKNPEGYEYSQFCLRFRAWLKTLDVALRQDYKAGEKLFVDFAGDTIPIHDPRTGAIAQPISSSPPLARATTPTRKPSYPRTSLPGSACTSIRSNTSAPFHDHGPR